MNRRYIALVGLSLVLGLSATAFAAAAPAPAAPSIPANTKRAETISAAQVAEIRGFVETQLGRLGSATLSEQQEAREALVRECDTSATAAYVDNYVQVLVAAAPKILDSGEPHARLNLAIVVGRIAERTKNLRLKSVALSLLGDKADGVVIWGARAIRTLMLPQLRLEISKDEPLLTKVVPAVSDNLGGFIAQELYEAYRLNILTERRNLTPEMLRAVVPPLLSLFRQRVALYDKGVPDEPQSETLASSFLSDTAVWAVMSDEQKAATLQACSQLIAGVGRRIVELELKDAQGRARRDELMQTVKLVTSAVGVIAQNKGDKNLENAAATMGQMNPTFDPAAVSKLCETFAEDIARAAKTLGGPAK